MGQSCSGSCSQSCGNDSEGQLGPRPTMQIKEWEPGFGRSSASAKPRPRGTDAKHVHFQVGTFQVNSSMSSASRKTQASGWKANYSLGKLLGDGVSAKVYLAEAVSGRPQPERPDNDIEPCPSSDETIEATGTTWDSCASIAPLCFRERPRRVAMKRFHRAGSRTFVKELMALRQVGVHPNILRLLESYHGLGGEDVLVLEYCDGSTLYDLYAREHSKGGLPEKLIVRLIRQLLLALEHLTSMGVEHQDIKPENMMLYDLSASTGQCELKLGDFGWAQLSTPGNANRPWSAPPTGAGSLWYAPPELNPPVPGATQDGKLQRPPPGSSDMWSVGVVLYLLLVGHNPFNTALKQATTEAIDSEVMRLAALGNFNRRAERWLNLPQEARELVTNLLKVSPSERISASAALAHPFLARRANAPRIPGAPVFFQGSISALSDRERDWTRLDGFQRLGWLAVARAVTEPELDRQVVQGAMESLGYVKAQLQLRDAQRGKQPGPSALKAAATIPEHNTSKSDVNNAAPGNVSRDVSATHLEDGYLFQLARELATTPVFQWLLDRGAWPEIVQLAFRYLDVDHDGLLGASDLATHILAEGPGRAANVGHLVVGAEAEQDADLWKLASEWVLRWRPVNLLEKDVGGSNGGLPLASFREALLSSSSCADGTAIGLSYEAGPDISVPAAARLSSRQGQAKIPAPGNLVRPPVSAGGQGPDPGRVSEAWNHQDLQSARRGHHAEIQEPGEEEISWLDMACSRGVK